ncbi:MAG TPA: peptidylprolyl isomerase, partial [Candidatus Nitrosotenuis sp.]|nr:peptidylprolyl isomerase [Candidatus Nitrosotenuis sp.]
MSADPYRGLQPFSDVQAPALTEVVRVRFTTDAGSFDVEVYPQAAPNAAERFVELVKMGFYDNTPVFRVVREPQPFVCQFGINWRGEFPKWSDRNFKDDPSLFQLLE